MAAEAGRTMAGFAFAAAPPKKRVRACIWCGASPWEPDPDDGNYHCCLQAYLAGRQRRALEDAGLIIGHVAKAGPDGRVLVRIGASDDDDDAPTVRRSPF